MRPISMAVVGLLLATSAFAGSVCGTVRDASTQQVIAGAELVLFLDGAPTAHGAASAVDGTYCIDDVPAGTYDLRVRRDDFLTTWITAIEVSDTATSVDVSWSSALRFDAPSPNPVSGRVAFRFRAADDAPIRLRVHDTRGRLVRGWDGVLDAGRPMVVDWNLETVDGRELPSGIYFVSLESRGQTVTHRFVCVR